MAARRFSKPPKTGRVSCSDWAGNPWIAQRLAMGHSGPVSRLVTAAAKPPPTLRELAKLAKLLKCDT
jgi:hypothetical protein